MIKFRCHHPNAIITLKSGFRVYFDHSIYETDDEEVIAELRNIVKLEATNSNRMIVEEGSVEGTRLTGPVTVQLNGLPEQTFRLYDNTYDDFFDQLKKYIDLPLSQGPSSAARFQQEEAQVVTKPRRTATRRPRKTVKELETVSQ